jgi:Tfp pilus assembly protein PilF
VIKAMFKNWFIPYEKSTEPYEKIVENDPNNVDAWNRLGIVHYGNESWVKAIESYNKALELDPKNVVAWCGLGNAYNETDEFKKAMESFENALELDPKAISAWCGMGITYTYLPSSNKPNELINYQKGIESCEKAIEIDPKSVDAWFGMGMVYYNVRNNMKAIESFKKVIAIDPDNKNAPKTMSAWYCIGDIYKKLKNPEKEKESYQKTILTKRFKFLRDDVFLFAQVNAFTESQSLIIQKINLKTGEVEFEDQIDCIHTAVTGISTEEFEDYQNGNDSQERVFKKTLEIRSSEKLEEIKLKPEEMFHAFKSWTAGIAEAGLSAFLIQDEIDECLDLLYPISQFLFRFMIKVDSDFLPQYLAKIEKECVFEGTIHESSFVANLIPVLALFWKNYVKNGVNSPEEEEIIKTLATMDISDKLFKSHSRFQLLRNNVDPNYNIV